MDDINVSGSLIKQKIEESLPKLIEAALSSAYNSPLKEAVDESIKTHEGKIKLFVSEIISTAISDPEFKKRVGDAVIAKVLASGMNR